MRLKNNRADRCFRPLAELSAHSIFPLPSQAVAINDLAVVYDVANVSGVGDVLSRVSGHDQQISRPHGATARQTAE